jgi:DNA gyrase/topoisomerase IV subunit A
MDIKKVILLFFFGFVFCNAQSQVCILDISSKNSDKIVENFQLKDEQLILLKTLKSDLKLEMDNLEKEQKDLFKNHPQSTPDELTILGQKHKVIEDKMFEVTMKYDQKLISSFNEKQYERYVLLCNTAGRTPIKALEK